MRLWHQSLISKLPRQQLLGQHRECCALRGRGWGRNHSTVNYVFEYSPNCLVLYHYYVMDEMESRGYHPDPIWRNPNWRGKELQEDNWIDNSQEDFERAAKFYPLVYPEHNDEYLQECVDNLKEKGIELYVSSIYS